MLDSPLAACAACSAPSDLAFECVDLQETNVGVFFWGGFAGEPIHYYTSDASDEERGNYLKLISLGPWDQCCTQMSV